MVLVQLSAYLTPINQNVYVLRITTSKPMVCVYCVALLIFGIVVQQPVKPVRHLVPTIALRISVLVVKITLI